MKIALFTEEPHRFSKVYTPEVMKKLSEYGVLSEKINRKNLAANADFLSDCKIAFSTRGMPRFTKEENAGSTGNEPQRMVYYIMEEMEKFISGEPTQYEVTPDLLERMA